MGLKKMFATNEQLEREGVWNEFGDVFRVLVARAGTGNPNYVKELQRVAKAHQRSGTLSIDQEQAIIQEVYAKTIVKGWQTKVDGEWVDGIDMDDEGGLLPCTTENLKRVFKELPDVFKSISQCADDAAAYRQKSLEDAAKNSVSS